MVEHHVQVYFDTVFVAVLDEAFEFVALPVILQAGGIAGVGGEEADGVVPPVVVKLLSVHLPGVLHLVKLENGHQLHGVDPQLFQVGNLLPQPLEGPGSGHGGGAVNGEAPDMELVDHQVLHGDQGPGHVAPVEVVFHHAGLVVLAGAVFHAPLALSRYSAGIRVQKILGLIKEQAFLHVFGTVHPEGVLKFLDVQLKHDHRVHIADAVTLRKGEDGVGLRLLPPEQQQFDGRGPVGVDREVYTAGDGGGSVDLVKTGAHVESVQMVHGDQVDGAGQRHCGGGRLRNRRLEGLSVCMFHRELLPRRFGDCRIRSHYTTLPQICHNIFGFL